MRTLLFRIPRIIAVLLVAGTTPAHAQVVRTALWQPNGSVLAMATVGSTVYVGGQFDHVAPHTGGFAQFDNTTGRIAGSLPAVEGKVYAMAPDGAGGWYIGGLFTSVEGKARANLAHVDGSGNLTAWNPGTNGLVQALAFDPANPHLIYVSGTFTTLGGLSRPVLGSVDAQTGTATAWQPMLSDNTGGPYVDVLALRGNLLYVGGRFQGANGLPRFNACAFDTGGTLQGFDPDVNGEVRAFALYAPRTSPTNLTIYLGGDFTRINGQNAAGLGAVDAAGATILLSAAVTGRVDALSLQVPQLGAITIYAGGAFQTVNGAARANLAAFDNTGALKTWNPGANGEVDALVYAGTVWIGGAFTSAGGAPRSRLAGLSSAGAATTWDPDPDGTVHCVGLYGSSVFAGGEFGQAGGIARRNLAAFNATTGVPTGWDPSPHGMVSALVFDGTNLWAGGAFDSIGGAVRPDLAQLSPTTGAANAFVLSPPPAGPIQALLLHRGLAYVAGPFTSVGVTARPALAAFNAQGQLTSWNPSSVPLGGTRVMAAGARRIFLGGRYSNDPSVVLTATSVDDSSGAPAGWNVYNEGMLGTEAIGALYPYGGGIFVGGSFSQVNGKTATNLAFVDTVNAQQMLVPDVQVAAVGGGVFGLLAAGTNLYVGGSQHSLGGLETGAIGLLDLTHMTPVAWDPGLSGSAGPLALAAGSVFGGGAFSGTLAQPTASISRLVGISTATTGVDDAPGPRPGALRVAPNPARGDMALRFALPAGGPARLEVYDVAGRRVRACALPARVGEQAATWDGRDDTGRRVPPGLYFVRVAAPGVALTGRAVRL